MLCPQPVLAAARLGEPIALFTHLTIFYFLGIGGLLMTVLINSYLALFNLIPVPPLDGSGILSGLLSDEAARKYDRIRPFGFIIVLALIYMGLLQVIIRPIELFILRIIFV